MSLQFRFPPTPRHLRVLRRTVRRELEEHGHPPSTVDDVVLVLDELVTNAIDHARGYRNAGQLRVSLEETHEGLRLEFEDPDMPADTVDDLEHTLAACRRRPPPPRVERGRGLFLISLRLRDLRVRHRRGGGLVLRGFFARGKAGS